MKEEMKTMKNLKTLIKSYKNEAKSDWAIKEDMADMYLEDANDAENALNFISDNNIETAARYISSRDTIVREAIVVAVAADKGADWVADNLGWNVN